MATASQQSVIGGRDDFWLYAKGSGFDLTHPDTPTSPPVTPRLRLETSKEPITIDPCKTALVPVDTQNYFLSPALGRPTGSVGLRVVDKLIKHAIPACRAAGIRVAWMRYGLSDEDLQNMPPMMVATTGDGTNFDGKEGGVSYGEELGFSSLYGPLEEARELGDLLLDKDRLSSFWRGLENARALKEKGIRTLVFVGANIDQCVASTLLDAFHEGFDIVLLSDGAATTSPGFATKCIQWNCEGGWGFLVICEELQQGVAKMERA